MDFFINELSLHGQFKSVASFVPAIKNLLQCKQIVEQHAHHVYCLRMIAQQMITTNVNFQQAVLQQPDINLKRIVTSWLNKNGPFLDEHWQRDANEWFEYEDNVVTDCVLGETVYRRMQQMDAACISFQPSSFMYSPLKVTWKRTENEQKVYEIDNFWETTNLAQFCVTYRKPANSWPELLIRLKGDYRELTFLDSILTSLESEPFNPTIAERINALMSVLNQLKTCFDELGEMNAIGFELLQAHFHGDKAWFSDESDTNKILFQAEMTFTLPTGESIFCSYHGKIRHRQYRIHFSWPIRDRTPLYIAYIGPKITRN